MNGFVSVEILVAANKFSSKILVLGVELCKLRKDIIDRFFVIHFLEPFKTGSEQSLALLAVSFHTKILVGKLGLLQLAKS